MTRGTLLVILGILTIVAPFAGLPNSWLMIILPIIGALVLIIGIFLRGRNQKRISA